MQNSPSLHHHHSFLQFPCSMSSSASFMPQQVEPPTTVQTKSSFSEIEPVHELPFYHLTLSEPSSFISPSLHTPRSIEPFISPLTETNLDYHKSTFCSSFEAKQHHVDSFIQNQKALLEQEHHLQRKTMAEIQSLIPLDTRSLDEELVLDDRHQQWADLLYSSAATTSRKRFSFSSLPAPTADRHGRTALIHSWFSNGIDYKGHETTGTTPFHAEQQLPKNSTGDTEGGRTPRKQWLKSLIRRLRFGQGKKRTKVVEGNDEEQQLQHHDFQRQSPLSLATMTATAIEEEKLRHKTTVDPTLEDDYQHYDDRRHQSKKAARHVSWSMGTSFEEYKLDKTRNMERDVYGNDTQGDSQRRSKIPHLFFPTRNAAAATYIDEPPSPSTPTTPSFLPHSAPASPTSSTNQKKGFGFSFVQQSLSSTKRSLLHPQKNLTRRRKRKVYHITPQDKVLDDNDDMEGNEENIDAQSYLYHQQSASEKDTTQIQRYSSGHLIESYSPRLSALKEETAAAAVTDVTTMAANRQNLVAFRYPRMVRVKDLRDAANHILTVDKYDVGSSSGGVGNGGEQMDNGHAISSGNWISSQLLYKYSSQKMGTIDQYDDDKDIFGGEDDDDDDDNSLIKYSRQYRNSTKRLSDPGAGLSAPPFPIGRPLSSFYD
ncbi:unnamed protein product [Absidia cylindrospora]